MIKRFVDNSRDEFPVPCVKPPTPCSTIHSVSVPAGTHWSVASFAVTLIAAINWTGGAGHVGVYPPEIFIEKSTTDPHVKLAQGSNGNDPPSYCITLNPVIPVKAIEGTVKVKLDNAVGGVPVQVPMDSLDSKIVFWFQSIQTSPALL